MAVECFSWCSAVEDDLAAHTAIAENMVLCVERSVRHMGYLGDFEETVVVTKDGCELLTDARVRWW